MKWFRQMKKFSLVIINLMIILSFSTSENSLFATDSLTNQQSTVYEQISKNLEISAKFTKVNLDSAVFYAELARQMIDQLPDDTIKVSIIVKIADIYSARGISTQSLGLYVQARDMLNSANTHHPDNTYGLLSEANILLKIGAAYFFQNNYPTALLFYEDVLKMLEKDQDAENSGKILSLKLRALNNIAGVYIQQADYAKALEYFFHALELKVNEGVSDSDLESSLYNNIGICYLELNDFKSANDYFVKSLNLRIESGDLRGQAQCYNNLGKSAIYSDNLKQAISYYDQALVIGNELGNYESLKVTLESLSMVYETLGDYKSAFYAHKQFKALSDSIYNDATTKKMQELEVQFKVEKQQQLFDLELKRTETEKQRQIFAWMVTGGTLFFLLLTTILLLLLQRINIRNTKLRQQKLELEHKNLELEKEKLHEELQFKNRELTTNVIYQLRKNEMITDIANKLLKAKLTLKPEHQKTILEIINTLKSSQDKDIWKEFETYFTSVHTDFYNRLLKEFPNLTSNEKKLCAFLRLNMSTKDISAITYQSVNTIAVARSRLRKKLNIEGEDINLVNFLMNF